MAQEVTKEFSTRLETAVEMHPLAPPSQYGRQAWLREKLRKEAGLDVSANTISKWFAGTAHPRQDNMRKLAKVLGVDEVWLALGRKPGDTREMDAAADRARGAALTLAGIIETAGGKATFAAPEDAPIDLHINFAGRSFDVIAVAPSKEADGEMGFLVSEPVGTARVIAVCGREDRKCGTYRLAFYDITDAPRMQFGGFSVMSMKVGKDGALTASGRPTPIRPMGKLADMAGAPI